MRAAGRTIAYVADEDDAALRTIDVERQARSRSRRSGARPLRSSCSATGDVVGVPPRSRARRRARARTGLSRNPCKSGAALDVSAEPAGLALAPDGATLFVASRWGHALTALATDDMARASASISRAILMRVVTSSDGGKIFVSHVAGSRISVVDIEGRSPRSVRSICTTYNQRRHVRGWR